MYCTRCGKPMAPEATFCQLCGTPVAGYVPASGDGRRLMRSRTDRKIAGVCAGVARHFDLDPTLVRVLWLLCLFCAGTGLLAYIILWIAIPEEPVMLPPGAPTYPMPGH